MTTENPEGHGGKTGAAAPTISVGMPVHNSGGLIRRALDSLLAQTWTDFEIIISDNGSTDDTARICEDYARRDRRVRYLRQDGNRGGAWNFQHVLGQARGRYFMWAAHDDEWRPTYMEKLLGVHRSRPNVACATARAVFTNGETSINTYTIEGPPAHRFKRFLKRLSDNSWFYGLYDRETLEAACRRVNIDIYAADWSVVGHVALLGDIVEVPETLLVRNTPKTHLGTVRWRDGVGAVFPALPFFLNIFREKHTWSAYAFLKCLLWNYRYFVKLLRRRWSKTPVALA